MNTIDSSVLETLTIVATASIYLAPFALAAIASSIVERVRRKHPKRSTAELIARRRAQIERNRARTTTNTRKAQQQ